jgi:hypothetical protein
MIIRETEASDVDDVLMRLAQAQIAAETIIQGYLSGLHD